MKLSFTTRIRRRAAVEGGGGEYCWLPLGAPSGLGGDPAPVHRQSPAWQSARRQLQPLLQQLPPASHPSVAVDLPLGTFQPGAGADDDGAVGLHFTLIPAKHGALVEAMGDGPQAVEFVPSKLSRWTTLSEWDAAQGRRVARSGTEMMTREGFRRLHTTRTAVGTDVQVALLVLQGTLHVLLPGGGTFSQPGMHVTCGADWVDAGTLEQDAIKSSLGTT